MTSNNIAETMNIVALNGNGEDGWIEAGVLRRAFLDVGTSSETRVRAA